MSHDELFALTDQALAGLDFVVLARQREEAHRRATAALLGDFLDVLDLLEAVEQRCRRSDLEQGASPAEAVAAAVRRLREALARAGVEPMSAAGQPLDVAWHEVLVARTDPAPEGTVLEEPRKGYLWNRSLLRRAGVVVARPAETDQPHREGS